MKKPGIMISVFLLLLSAIGAVSVYSFFDTNTVSAQENRTLTPRPELTEKGWLSGAYATALEDFLSDHVYGRGELMSAAKRMESLMERKTEIKMVTHNAADIAGNPDQRADQAPAQDSGQAEPDTQTQGGALVEEGAPQDEETASRLMLDDRILLVYTENDSALDYYAEVANRFFAMFPDYMPKYLVAPPCRIAFETPEIAAYSGDQRAGIRYVYDRFDSLISTVDAYSALEERIERLDDYYFRTDHHWTHLAAFYAAQAVFDAAGLEPLSLDDYSRNEGNSFLGYLYAQDPEAGLKEHRDELVYYLPKDHAVPTQTLYLPGADSEYQVETGVTINPQRGGYYTFLAGSFAYAVLDGPKDDGSCLLVSADSYGNSLCTWLVENYDKVIMIDCRYFKGGKAGVLQLAEDYGVTDVMICNCLSSISSSYYTSQFKKLTQ